MTQWFGSVKIMALASSLIHGRALWVSTWMSDCLWMDKPSWYVTDHLGPLSLPSLRDK